MIAYLVMGPESTGTRLMTSILIKNGCIGSSDHAQPFDNALPPAQAPIVWRRSYPHAHQYPDAHQLTYQLINAGYSPRLVIMSRDWAITASSQIHHGHVTHADDAYTNIRAFYRHVFTVNVPQIMINYEALVNHPLPTVALIFALLGAPSPNTPGNIQIPPITNENDKWL